MKVQAVDRFDVRERVILLTGGCGLLGSEYARAFAAAGARVVIADSRGEVAEGLAAEIVAGGGEALAVEVDVAGKPSVIAMVDATLRRFGRVDVLINNAAIDPKFGAGHEGSHSTAFEDYPLSLWNQSIAVNVTGMFLCAQAVAGPMLSQGRGSIINVSSMYGLVGPHQSLYETAADAAASYKPVAYSVTKSATLGLTRYLASYWAGKCIRINTLTLGGVYHGHDEEFVTRYSQLVPIGRMADRTEYCGAMIFLASDASSYMTGANLVVDGGWTAW